MNKRKKKKYKKKCVSNNIMFVFCVCDSKAKK